MPETVLSQPMLTCLLALFEHGGVLTNPGMCLSWDHIDRDGVERACVSSPTVGALTRRGLIEKHEPYRRRLSKKGIEAAAKVYDELSGSTTNA